MTTSRLRYLSLAALAAAFPAFGCGDGSFGDNPDDPTPDAGSASDAAVRAADAGPGPDAQPCLDGDDQVVDEISGHCYFFVNEEVTWDAAVQACGDLGAHLAAITTAEENTLVLGIGPAIVEDVWLGADDRSIEGTFQWITNEPMPFDGFRSGEPNNGGVDSVNGEDCMVMEVDRGGTWDDRNCDVDIGQVHPYFCEREP